jgi:uncharacterized protein YuzE
MDLTYREDKEAGAAYLSFGYHVDDVVATVNYQQDKNIDFDADGNIVGIEFLSLPPTIEVTELHDYVKLDPQEALMIQDFLIKATG